MKIQYFDYSHQADRHAANIISAHVRKNPRLSLCAATGNSTLGVYTTLQAYNAATPGMYRKMKVIALDEWVGLSNHDQGSCTHYLQQNLIGPLGISSDNFIAFNGKTANLEGECLNMRDQLAKLGPFDICILGLGKNGHLGFNEPDEFQDYCHVARLTKTSMTHQMIEETEKEPEFGLTLGMQEILASRSIIMMVSGEGKEEARRAFFSKRISRSCPASMLWGHPQVDCLVVGRQT